jgi:hypothetical protein
VWRTVRPTHAPRASAEGFPGDRPEEERPQGTTTATVAGTTAEVFQQFVTLLREFDERLLLAELPTGEVHARRLGAAEPDRPTATGRGD